jgi:opacity protein-like surface antigen
MNKLRVALAMSGALLLTGVFSAPVAHAQPDPRQAMPPPGRALVYVYRSEREPVVAKVPVSVNAEVVGQLASGTFLVATVAPGRTFVRSGDRVLSAVAFQAEPNRRYFVRIEAVSGTRPVRTETRLATDAEGRRAVAQSQFAGAAPAVIAAPRAAAPAPKPAPSAAKPSAQAAKPAAPPATAKPAPQAAKPASPRPAARAAPARKPEETGWDIALIVKGGTFEMSSGDQTVGSAPSTFETASKPAAGIELEWRSRSGPAVGAEVFYYKNEFATAATSSIAKQEIYATMVNGKYYFRVAEWFYPYVGAGVGLAVASYGGNLTGNADGLAFQGLAGAEFRFSGVGLHLQVKYLAATTEGTLATTGATEKVKVGGAGALAGISFVF